MFVGRDREQAWLAEMYLSNKFQFCVLYGRRRVGKTALLQQFIKDKKAIFFLATQTGEQSNLSLLSQAIHQAINPGMDLAPFSTFEAAFTFVAQAAQQERLVLVIDEYPYLAETVPGLASLLQRLIDLQMKDSRLMLILCGSSMHFMEQQVLHQKSPLYGRRTAQFKLLPFTYAECLRYFQGASAEDVAVYYGASGGVAEYLSFIDPKISVDDNLIRLFFEGRGRLYEEPANLLNQELRDPKVYNDILGAIAGGASQHNDIALGAGLPATNINAYLKTLMELRIIKRELPPGQQGAKKAIYRMEDLMFRFWYRFVQGGRRLIETGQGAAYYNSQVKPQLPAYMGEVYERMVLEYMDLQNASGAYPVLLTELGRWWGTDRQTRQAVEIDVVGLGTGTAVLAEAKWTKEKIGMDIMEALQEKGRLISGQKRYILFSKNGFAAGLLEEGQRRADVHLVDLATMAKQLTSA